MSYEEIKKLIIFHYHKNIDYWYKLVGEMFETTDGFTKYGEVNRNFNGEKHCITWENYSWYISE